jgi:cytoskeletal protein RodZ
MAHPYTTVTADDVASANRETLSRATAVARIAGIGLIVIGVVGLAAWLWFLVRQQQDLNSNRGVDAFGQPAPSAGFRDRIDAAINSITLLLWATLTLGGGFALRLLGQYSFAQAGGSLTGFEVGDTLPSEDSDEAMSVTPPSPPEDTTDASSEPTDEETRSS